MLFRSLFDATDFHQKGALVVAENVGEYEGLQSLYGDRISAPIVVDMIYKSPFGKKKKKQFVWGIYQGEQNEE